ncbi:MAG: hypothetical protein RLY31_2810 [Bacteroidota bacterium]|jgi:hypothetical protein
MFKMILVLVANRPGRKDTARHSEATVTVIVLPEAGYDMACQMQARLKITVFLRMAEKSKLFYETACYSFLCLEDVSKTS